MNGYDMLALRMIMIRKLLQRLLKLWAGKGMWPYLLEDEPPVHGGVPDRGEEFAEVERELSTAEV